MSLITYIKTDSKSRDTIISELTISSDSHLSFINELVKNKRFLTEERMMNIKNSHISFLNDEFLSIIEYLCTDKQYKVIYDGNHDLLDEMIKEDNNKINDIFKIFIDKINIKKQSVKKSLLNDSKQGTNYSMKETENLKENKVTVQIKKGLKSEIEQDF